MAKFCTKCGKMLEEGEVCSCLQTVGEGVTNQQESEPVPAAPVEGVQFDQVKKQSSVWFRQVIQVFLSCIRQPALSGRYTAEGNHAAALGLIGLQAILTGLVASVAAGKMNSLITLLFSDDSVKLSAVKLFLLFGIGSFLLSCILAGAVFLLAKLLKGNFSYQNALAAVGTKCAIVSVWTVFSLIIFILNIGYGILCFLAGGLLGIIILATAVQDSGLIKKNSSPYLVFLAVIILLVAIWLYGKAVIPLCIPEGLKSAITSFAENPFGSLLNGGF